MKTEPILTARLLWGVYCMGYLQNINDYGRLTWLFNDECGQPPHTIGRRDLPTNTYALACTKPCYHNPIIVDKVLKRTTEQWARDAAEKRDVIAEHLFYKQAQNIHYFPVPSKNINIFDLLLRYPDGNPGDPDLVSNSQNLMKMLFQELTTYFVQVFGRHREPMAKQQAFAYIDQLVAGSTISNKPTA
jgi:hypothetical protein